MYKKIEQYIEYLLDKSTKECFIWNVEKIKQNKPMNWNYIDGCMMKSLLELSEVTNNKKYFDFVENAIDNFILEDGTIKTYNLTKYSLDDICESTVLFKLYTQTKKEKYLKAIEKTYTQIKYQPRTFEGSFWHKLIYPHQVWLDGFYMVMPFYTEYQNFHNLINYDDIINQYTIARTKMFDENKGLYYHGYDASKQIFWANKTTGKSESFWLRSIGWFFVSLIEVYEKINSKNEKKYLENLIKELANNLLNYQDEQTKLFYQVVDQKEKLGNYLETSGSAMIAYTFLKASRLNVLDKSFTKTGKEIFDNICKNYLKEENNTLELGNICLVSGLGPADNKRRNGTFEYYISEPIVKNDAKGVAPFIMAYVELKRGGLC